VMVSGSVVYAGYVLVFGLAALGCIASLPRALTVEDHGTRYGLVGLLACSGGWAAFELLFLLVGGPTAKYAAYTGSLVVGLATVGAWLYFCSAYTGRRLHREPTYRRLAVGVYLGVVGLKLTNPVHGLYFDTQLVQEPFVHLTIRHGVVHWVVTGLSYALVGIGFFMLYEMFLSTDYDTAPLGAVVAVTALPAAFDILGVVTSVLLDVNHEAVGVAAFAVGVLYVYEEQFLSVQVTGDVDDPVVFLDSERRVRDYNDHARTTFPELEGAVGVRLGEVLPEAVAAADDDQGIVEREGDDRTRYYLVSDSAFSIARTDIGKVLVFADVTATERRRRELERQNEQLEGMAAAIRHELRNTLQVVSARVAIAGEAIEDGDVELARESFEAVAETTDRMERVVDDLSTLAQYGQTLDRTDWVEFEPGVRAARDRFDGDRLSLSVEGRGYVEAESGRFGALLENAFRFAAHNGASTVTVALRDGGFTITDDGDPPGEGDPETFFEYGGAVPGGETGVTLPNLRTLARVHGWSAEIDPDYRDGVRIVISGVETQVRRAATAQ